MGLKSPLRNFFPNYKSVLKILPTRAPLRKTALPGNLFRTKTLQFIVDKSTNKITFREYIQKVYGIEVKKVNSVNLPGKTFRNQSTRGWTKYPDYKKMFVHMPHWVQVPWQPRPRTEFEHAIDNSQADYAANFRRFRHPPHEFEKFRERQKREKETYYPENDRALKPRLLRKVPERMRED